MLSETVAGGSSRRGFLARTGRLLVGLAGGILFFAFSQVRDAWMTPVALTGP